MRKKFVAGNWKMFTDRRSGEALARAVVAGLAGETRVQVAVCPPFPYLLPVGSALQGSPVALGAQNCYVEREGAFTGEVSPWMLADCGCKYVILGHSERRHKLHEPDGLINQKVHAALEAGLQVILCVGETIDERKANRTEKVLQFQVAAGLVGLKAEQAARLVIAYEPVWAIGTGQNATPEQAQAAHAFIRQQVGEILGENAARSLPIQYGGSVKPDNAGQLLSQADVDGALVGGASLKAEQFLPIVRAALA